MKYLSWCLIEFLKWLGGMFAILAGVGLVIFLMMNWWGWVIILLIVIFVAMATSYERYEDEQKRIARNKRHG